MYELLALKHPLWIMGPDDRDKYRDKLMKTKQYEFPDYFTEQAISFFKHMCDYRPSNRYTVETALYHPWITRKRRDRVPLNPLDDKIYTYEMGNKL